MLSLRTLRNLCQLRLVRRCLYLLLLAEHHVLLTWRRLQRRILEFLSEHLRIHSVGARYTTLVSQWLENLELHVVHRAAFYLLKLLATTIIILRRNARLHSLLTGVAAISLE